MLCSWKAEVFECKASVARSNVARRHRQSRQPPGSTGPGKNNRLSYELSRSKTNIPGIKQKGKCALFSGMPSRKKTINIHRHLLEMKITITVCLIFPEPVTSLVSLQSLEVTLLQQACFTGKFHTFPPGRGGTNSSDVGV